MTYILFTHDDLDGAGCDIVFSIALMSVARDVIHCSNVNVDQKVMELLAREEECERIKDAIIYFADIVPSRDVLEALKAKHKVLIFDHHRTNFWVTTIIPDAVIVPSDNPSDERWECGTSLLFQHLLDMTKSAACSQTKYFSEEDGESKGHRFIGAAAKKYEPISIVVDIIRSYDTYEWKRPGKENIHAKYMNTLFWMLGMDTFVERMLLKICSCNSPRTPIFDESEIVLIEAKLKMEQQIIDKVIEDYNDPTKNRLVDFQLGSHRAVLQLNSTGAPLSELAYQFLHKYPDIDIFVGLSMYGDPSLSLRTIKEDIHVGTMVCAPLGGGGHAQAGGIPLPMAIKVSLLNGIPAFLNGEYGELITE